MIAYLTDEPLRIIRPLRKGEKLPVFSIVRALTNTGAHYGIKTPGRKPGSRKGYANKGSLKAAKRRVQKAAEFREGHHAAIRRLLKEFLTNDEISAQIGLTYDLVSRIICKSEELRKLSKKRSSVVGSSTSHKTKASKEYFSRQKEEILSFLETGSFTAACVKYKFDHRTLKKYLAEDEVKNG